MTFLAVGDIVSRVRQTLNESQVNESEFYTGADESELDGLIRSRALEALNFVHGTAEAGLLDADRTVSAVSDAAPVGGGYLCAVVPVPGFSRLKSIHVGGWARALSELGDCDSPEYAKQSDPYACGTPERPVAFLCDYGVDKKIELYSLVRADTSVSVQYMVYRGALDTDATGAEGVSVSDRLVDAYVYYLAGLVLVMLNDPHADDLLNMACSLMGVQSQAKREEGGQA